MTKKYLWDNSSISKAVDGDVYGGCFGNRVVFDSRKVVPGDIFVALKGERADGHNYVDDVLSKGGGAVMVDHIPRSLEKKEQIIKVKNTFDAVKAMALFNRGRTRSKVVGITGSVGKTSTKETIYQILKSVGGVFCTPGNFNGQIGIPFAVASMPIGVKYGIYEMGMSHAGEMTKITEIVKPDIAIITNIFGVHLENFKSVSDIARAKAEIFYGMNSDGTVLLNQDNKYTGLLIELAKSRGIKKIYTFGTSVESDACLRSYRVSEQGFSVIKANICGDVIEVAVPICGEHQALNIISALLLAKKLDIDLQEAICGLKDVERLKGRGKVSNLVCDNKSYILVDESYNASPASVVSSLKSFRDLCGANNSIKRRVAILGDMYELGADEKDLHRGLLDPIKFNTIDKVITVGSLMKELFSVLPEYLKLAHFEDCDELLLVIKDLINTGDALLVKGSNGTKLHEVVKYLEKMNVV